MVRRRVGGVSRRSVLGAGLAFPMAALTACGEEPGPSTVPSRSAAAGSSTTASPSAAAGPSPSPAAGDDRRLRDALRRYLKPTAENPQHPTYAGAVLMATVDGRPVAHLAVGDALRYRAGPVELPAAERVPMRRDSIFDLASITKVYTALLVLQQVDRGKVELAAPVVEYLPEFAGAGTATITVEMLLTHTGGLPVGADVLGLSTVTARRAAILRTAVLKGAVPGDAWRYSGVGLVVLGYLVEKVTGRPLDAVLRTELTGPLGLRDTGFKPLTWLAPDDRAARLVATDARSSRGLLRGVVHDQIANALGGVAGHAGIFSTAADVAVIGALLGNGGVYGGKRILAEATVRRMLANANGGLPAFDAERPGRSSDHGLGVALNQPWFMGRLASPRTFGHTGFTGTSLLVDPDRRLVVVLLTNRAHPNWSWANPDPVRVAVANVIADSMPLPHRRYRSSRTRV